MLALAGVLLLFAGVCAVLATALPALGVGFAASAVLQTLSLGFGLASWRARGRHGDDDRAALCTSWAATIPGALLLMTVAMVSEPPRVGNLLLTTNLLWLVVAPYLFFTSAVTSPLRGALRSLTLARFAHVTAWLSSSFLALSCWL